jgi:hypothetical protein
MLRLRRDLSLAIIETTLHADHPGGEVHVLSMEPLQLSAAKAGVEGRRPHRPILRRREPRNHRLHLIGVGIDIGGGERSESAVVWINERGHIGVEILSGDRAVLQIAEVVYELAERFTIAECTFDPWQGGGIGQELDQRGIRTSVFPQSDARMCPASQRLHDSIVEGRITHPNDPRLNAHVATAIARRGRRGWRIDKAGRADKIDACIALAMALDRLENRPEPAKVVAWW